MKRAETLVTGRSPVSVKAMEDRKRSVPHETSDEPPTKRQALATSQPSQHVPQSQEDVVVSNSPLHHNPTPTCPTCKNLRNTSIRPNDTGANTIVAFSKGGNMATDARIQKGAQLARGSSGGAWQKVKVSRRSFTDYRCMVGSGRQSPLLLTLARTDISKKKVSRGGPNRCWWLQSTFKANTKWW